MKRLFLAIFFLISLSFPCWAIEQQHVVTFGQNLNFSLDRLDEAITKIGSSSAAISLRYGTWTLDSNVTVPSNIHFSIPAGAVITGPYTLTINGNFSGSKACFGSTLTVVFGSASVDEVLPKWFNETVSSLTRTRASIAVSGIPIFIGKVSADPSTTGWGAPEAGTRWYNTADQVWKFWTGAAIASQYTGFVDVREYASINAAVTAIGATQTTLVVPTAQTLTANLTIPSTLTLKILNGGSIVKASTYTLTINGPFEAGPYPVFSGFASGNITFGGGSVRAILPEWWSADIAGINLAIGAAANILNVELQPKTTYSGSALITISTAKLRLYGHGQDSKISSSSTTGAILISNLYVELKDLQVYYTGSGAYGIKIDNGTTQACTGADRVNLQRLRIEGTAGTSHGLWLRNVFEGNFEDINLPGGDGNAVFLESSINNHFKRIICNPNVVESAVTWAHGIVLGYLTGSSFHSFGNTFIRCNMTLTSGNGLHLTDVVTATSQPCNLNNFIDCTFEANNININIEHGAKNYFYNAMTSAGVAEETIIQNISYGNVFIGGQTNVDMPNPGGAQYAQGNMFIGLAGDVDIQSGNVFGTVLIGVDSYTDGGVQTYVLQTSIGATAGTATTAFKFPKLNDDTLEVMQNSSVAIEGSGGSFRNVCLLPAGTGGKIYVEAKENGTVNVGFYQILFLNGSATASHTVVDSVLIGGATGTLDFQVAGGYLQARGKSATPPSSVKWSMEYRSI